MDELRGRALLSIQRGLLGEITPQMRKITVEITQQLIKLWVFWDGPFDHEAVEDFDASVITEIVADFAWPERGDPKITLEFVRSDSPSRIEHRGICVYARKENR